MAMPLFGVRCVYWLWDAFYYYPEMNNENETSTYATPE